MPIPDMILTEKTHLQQKPFTKPPTIEASSGEFDSLYIVTSILAQHLPFLAPDSILEG
ncbi:MULTISPECIES: hypothetical protein [Brevibacillus]|uniref:hypothetical protein n=1 Tax=Brevibacillus TaxID=55080 RepID=UPI001E42EDC2|nr:MULTISPECIES: hypothetical protein [Brevibacillus]MED1948301.1 hypothetical protein [Brevibacillus formosus]MED1997968.1 hypothetical protein [Brevibacillus formosus]MED2080509.1 hypothetical protein [Brevibacillus formosus]